MASSLQQRLLAIDGVVESPSMYSDGSALWANGTEIAHQEADGTYVSGVEQPGQRHAWPTTPAGKTVRH